MCKSQKVATFLAKSVTSNSYQRLDILALFSSNFTKCESQSLPFFSTMKQLDAHVGLFIYRTIFETIFFPNFFFFSHV